MTVDLRRYRYERGEGRSKHKWSRDAAGFVPGRNGAIGKCHSSITEEVAESLLHDGLVELSVYEDAPSHPDKIFAIYRGVPYVAVPTMNGLSFHGYPWSGRMSATLERDLRERAVLQGPAAASTFKKWMKEHRT